MKVMSRLVFGAAVLASTAAFAQSSATANATARIITAISLAKNTDLNFGDIVPGGTAGTVVLTPAGVRTPAGGIVAVTNTFTPAAFTVSGQAGGLYTVTLPVAAVTLSSGANSMTVDTFTSNPSGTAGVIAGGGTQALAVGGTLHVGATQASGTYTGTFTVSVAYN